MVVMKWEDCRYFLMIGGHEIDWDFSRTGCRHTIIDWNGKELFKIKDCASYGMIHEREHGFDLYFKGKVVAHAGTVKELKLKAAEIAEKKGL